MNLFKLTTAIAIALVATSCSGEKKEPKKKKVITKNEGLVIGDPLDCGLDSLTLFPVGCSYDPKVVEGAKEIAVSEGSIRSEMVYTDMSFAANSVATYDMNATVEYVNENNESYDIRNLLFYDFKTGESYALVKDSVHILSFAIHKEFSNPMIIYRVVKEDYNKDNKFDAFDPVMLYVSELNGKNFQAVTPPDEFYIRYELNRETNSMLIKTAIDSNGDKKFLADDETNFRMMRIDAPKMAKNIFSDKIKDDLRKFQ